jgi:hypothetical protein
MKVRIIRPTIAQKRQVLAGEVLDVSNAEGVILIGAGKAAAVKDAAPETATLPRVGVETAAVEPSASITVKLSASDIDPAAKKALEKAVKAAAKASAQKAGKVVSDKPAAQKPGKE